MKLGIVTTFSDNGYNDYAKHFVESSKVFLDKDIKIYFYVDNIKIEESKNIIVRKLEPSIPELTDFKERNKNRKPESFLFDGVRFSHKSYCLYHCANNSDVDHLFWLDSDTEIFNHVSKEYLMSFLPEDVFVSYLGRDHIKTGYTETGFLGFNLTHKRSKEFFEIFKNYYDTDNLYNLKGQLDCHVFDAARKEIEEKYGVKNHDIGINYKKHHFNNNFSGHMVHYKGPRKQKRDGQLQMAKLGKSKIK